MNNVVNAPLRRAWNYLLTACSVFCLLLIGSTATAQNYIPGKIVRPATNSTARGILDPNLDGFVSATTSGYAGQNDVSVAGNELAYRPIYPFFAEPNSDLRRGPDKRFTDYVPSTIDKASYYMYYTGTNLLFRVRMGSIIPGAKGYAFLIDIDGKFGFSGPLADPNYLPATTGVGGNPGFEIEVDLFSQAGGQTGIAVYNIDGKDKRNDFLPAAWSVNNWLDYSQVSMAATSDNGDPDYYVDFYIPFTAMSGITFAAPTTPTNITTSTSLRIIPTTVMSPLPAVGGPKSDIYGLPDYLYPNANDEYIAMLGSMPPIVIDNFTTNGSGQSSTACTYPPTLNKISSASTPVTVSGTWTPNNTSGAILSNVVITLYRSTNGGSSYSPFATTATITAATSTTTVNWSIPSVPVGTNDRFYAVAQAPGESACFQSATVTASACSGVTLPVPNLGCATTTKGFDATNKPTVWANAYPGTYVNVVNGARSGRTAAQSTSGTVAGSGTILSTQGTAQSFAETGTAPNVNWTFSAGCQSGAPLESGTYRFWYTDANGCAGNPAIGCVLGNGGNTPLAGTLLVPTITSPANGLINSTTTSITASGSQGSTMTLYVNGVATATGTAGGNGAAISAATSASVTFSGLTLSKSDKVLVVSEYVTGTASTSYCGQTSAAEATVSCVTEAPSISTNSASNLLQPSGGGFIQGFSSAIGGTVTVYNSAAPGTSLGTATVSSTGSWTSAVTPTSGQSYVVTVTATSGCTSGYSTALLYSNATTSSSLCTGAAISSYTTSYSNGVGYTGVGTTITNGPPTSSSFAMNAFATTVTVAFATSSNPRLVTLYEDGNFVASTRVAANATTAVFSNGISTGDNLGFYTGTSGSTSPGNVYFTISDTSTTLQVYLPETTCPNVGVVTCPVSTTAPTLTVANCPTCTATGSSTATVPSGGTVTFKLSGVTPNSIYALRSTTGTSYSNTFTVPANFVGTDIYITSFPISGTNGQTVNIEAVGTTVIVSNNVAVSCAATSTSATVTLGTATSLGINGTVYDDPYRYNIGGTPVSTVTNALNTSRQLYVYIVNNSNVIQNGMAVTATGTYSFTGLTSGTTYKVILDTAVRANGTSLSVSTIPYGWTWKAEGTSGGSGDGLADGIYTASNLTTTQIIDFGINGIPLANTNTAVSQLNPGGTTTATVPGSTFSGSDPRDVNSTGIVEFIRVTGFPTNATSITLTGAEKYTDAATTVTYYPSLAAIPNVCSSCAVFPAGGLYVAATTSGNPTTTVLVDPVNGAVTVGIPYVLVDNGGKESGSGTANQPFSTLSISGTLYNDYNGLSDNLINGNAGNGGQTVYVNAVSGGAVIGTATVAADGTYTVTGLYAGSYSLVLTTSNSSLAAAVPSAWINTGEGSGTTSDGTVDGSTPVTLVASNVTGRNFGYNRSSTADAKNYLMGPNTNPAIAQSTVGSTANPGSNYAAIITLSGAASSGATPGALTGNDPDGNSGGTLTLTQQVSNVSVVIDPSTYAGTRHGSSYVDAVMPRYNGVQLQPNGCFGADVGNPVCNYFNPATKVWELPAYSLSQLQLLVRNGTSSFSFSYAWKDAAGSVGTSAAYAVSFEQPLPVRLITFNGEKRNSVAALNWTASDEQSFRGYAVERSTDGRSFSRIGFVNARGMATTQSYNYNDDLSAINAPYVYYRLRLDDLSGSFSYSAVVRIALHGKAIQGVQVLGNPVRTPAIRLSLQADAATKASILLADGSGRVLARFETSVSSGNTQLSFPLPAHLAAGSYTLISHLGEEVFSQTVLLDR